ncbi:MAG TPA: CDP-alcohol phosphatidyltransferase family protein [Thermoanaerobaculia bacterium]|nr:CDP-alcohol phosphatidyltransferase family protein [Thermoanaerobaculia bacterium]
MMSLTVPNLLSILRMGLVPVFIIAVTDGKPWQALAVFLIAGITDLFDGLIARFWHQQSRLGAYLDPMADKLLLISAYLSLSLASVASSARIPFWVTVLVIARDLVIVVVSLVFYLALGITNFPPATISKITTAAQVIAVLLVLIAGIAPGLEPVSLGGLYVVAGLTILSGLNYIVLANRMVAAKHASAGSSGAES